jgi:predicted deacylase
MHSPDPGHFVIADHRGLFEMLLDLGDAVTVGQPILQVHDVEKPASLPQLYRSQRSGILVGRRVPGPTQPGDCLAVIAADLEE